MILNKNIEQYIQKLEDIKDKMTDEVFNDEWTPIEKLEIGIAIGYIGAAIYGLELSGKNEK